MNLCILENMLMENILCIQKHHTLNIFQVCIRGLQNIEGVVITYVNTRTNELFRQKHKTNWYVVWRAWREAIGNKKEMTTHEKLVDVLLKRNNSKNTKRTNTRQG